MTYYVVCKVLLLAPLQGHCLQLTVLAQTSKFRICTWLKGSKDPSKYKVLALRVLQSLIPYPQQTPRILKENLRTIKHKASL